MARGKRNALSNFHDSVRKWFVEQFAAPSPPQAQGWPAIADGKHTLILAPTGSGKTLAAFLWCIDEILRLQLDSQATMSPGVHTLYISPLKALNNDIHRNLQEPLQGIRRQAKDAGLSPPEIRALVRTGDTPAHTRQSMVKRPPHILITTPESLYLLLTSERGREIFRGLRYLIVDEIHALSNSKRGVHLSLTLERLMPLCQTEPVRVGLSATQRPLDRIAAFLGGQRYVPEFSRYEPRPVTIIDCGQRKDLDLQVISPVASFSDLPESTVWPAVIKKLYELITAHETTLVFVNMRAQTERVARLLNEMHQKQTGDPDAVLALAHHGSISREARYDIEARLKAGKIPAVIATASLELGIDIGSIDLVVQLEAPRTVSGGLQRVGRSGHVLSATSKGRIILMYPSDLDDAVAIVQLMQKGEIEQTVIPENCLDVLAQQIVAEVAMRDWPREAFFRLIRQSYCYRHLTENAFDRVLEMLAGRYAETPLRVLQPKISWDRVNDRLIGLRGTRLHATIQGGTIPDRGYYSVYLADSNARLGEMEEEFVFESRVGHVFFLGNNEWRIEEIKHDRIVVSPVRAVKPRAPFWKGDLLYRDFETSQKIGAFRRVLSEQPEHADGDDFVADRATLANLQAYLQRQREATAVVPDDKQIVVEWFRDSADEPHLILHTCFGARVNGLWAIALAAAVEQRYGTQVQFTHDDDGLLLRSLDATEPIPIQKLLRLSADELEALLNPALIDTPIFTVRFRYNATRALILPRSQPGKRIPLWLQRLRAADLLQVVRQHPDFPIVAETYRDCLHDVFDLLALRQVADQLQRGEVRVHYVQTPVPSPMASGLLFDFLSENLYEGDHSRLPAQAAALSSDLLADILLKETIATIVTANIVQQAEARWQHLTPEFQARDAEELFAVIEKMAPITEEALAKRSKKDPAAWLTVLQNDGRIVAKTTAPIGWLAMADQKLFAGGFSEEIVCERLRRFLRVCGPVSLAEIGEALFLPKDVIEAALRNLHLHKEVVRGRLLVGTPEEQWCDRQNFAELYRRAVSARREAIRPADEEQFIRFQLGWHNVDKPEQDLNDLAKRYAGLRFPVGVFEREILRSRLCASNSEMLQERIGDFSKMIERGELIARAHRSSEAGRFQIDFIPRASGSMFMTEADADPAEKKLSDEATGVHNFLKENGASLVRDVSSGVALTLPQTLVALGDLTRRGLATCDNYAAFLSLMGSDAQLASSEKPDAWLPQPLPGWTQNPRARRRRKPLRDSTRQRVELGTSRWFLTSSFAVLGKPLDRSEIAIQQARLLLGRYGILVKEWYRREAGLLPWYDIFQVLKRLEWQGEIRRGYFIAGLSGVQFALPSAVELLEKIQTGGQTNGAAVLLSTMDPALTLLVAGSREMADMHGNPLSVVRSASNHFVLLVGSPVFYSENYGSLLRRLAKIPQGKMSSCVGALKGLLQVPAHLRPRKRIQIEQINGQPAAECRLVEAFLQNGFERDGDKLVLWPSGI